MYSLHLSAEQIEFRDTVRSFVEDEVKPVVLNANRLDAGDRALPMDVLDKASQMGLRTLALSEDLGGVGADALTCCLVIEELAAGDADIAAVLAGTTALAGPLFAAMTQAQRDKFLPAFIEDDRYHLALADHEPDTDTSLGINYHRASGGERRVRTKAERNGSNVIVNGVKDAVANASVAKLFAVEVTTDQGIRTLLVPAGSKGLTVTENAERWYHGSCGEIVLQNCEVPADNLLPAESQPARRCGTRQPAAAGRQSRHWPRCLRGRARLRAASCPGRPGDRGASGDRRKARRRCDTARSGARRDLAGRDGRRIIRPRRPTAACPTCR